MLTRVVRQATSCIVRMTALSCLCSCCDEADDQISGRVAATQRVRRAAVSHRAGARTPSSPRPEVVYDDARRRLAAADRAVETAVLGDLARQVQSWPARARGRQCATPVWRLLKLR